MPETGWLLSNRSFSLFWRLKSKNRVPAWLGAGEIPVLGRDCCLGCVLTFRQGQESPGPAFLIRALHPHHVTTSPVSLVFRCCCLRGELSAKEFGGDASGRSTYWCRGQGGCFETRVEPALEFWETWGKGVGAKLEVVLIEFYGSSWKQGQEIPTDLLSFRLPSVTRYQQTFLKMFSWAPGMFLMSSLFKNNWTICDVSLSSSLLHFF